MLQKIIEAVRDGQPLGELVKAAEEAKAAKDREVESMSAGLAKVRKERDTLALLVERLKA